MDHDPGNSFPLYPQAFSPNGALRPARAPFNFEAHEQSTSGFPVSRSTNDLARPESLAVPAAEHLAPSRSSAALSDVQLGSIHDLLQQGIPIPVVASVMESMLNRQSLLSTTGDSSAQLARAAQAAHPS